MELRPHVLPLRGLFCPHGVAVAKPMEGIQGGGFDQLDEQQQWNFVLMCCLFAVFFAHMVWRWRNRWKEYKEGDSTSWTNSSNGTSSSCAASSRSFLPTWCGGGETDGRNTRRGIRPAGRTAAMELRPHVLPLRGLFCPHGV